MKKQLFLLILALLCVPLARAQTTYPTSYSNGGNVTSTNTACVPTACVGITLPGPTSAVITVGITGTFSATLAVEQSQDGGTTFTSAGTSLTSTGTTSYVIAGFTQFRVRASAFVSGNAGVNLQVSSAPSGGVTSGTADPTGNACAANALYVRTTNGALYTCNAGVFAIVSSGGTGTVTSVSFTGGLFSIATPTTTPAITVAGTSGGIVYFSNGATWASSAALTLGGVVLGGGAGGAPTTNAGLSYSAGTLTCGIPGSAGCVITGAGAISGTATITWPGVAGTAGNAIAFSNAISSGGSITATGGMTVGASQGYFFSGRSVLTSGADGILTATNNAITGFSRFTFGPATSAFPAACPSGTTLLIGLANGNCTTLAPLSASVLSAGGFTAVGIGTATQVYNTAQTAQNASVAATTMLANPAADRNFRFNVYIGQLAQGTTCTLAGSVAVSLIYTDPITGNAYTYVIPLDASGGTSLAASVPLSTSAPTVANVGNGTMPFRAKASTNIQYSTTYVQGTCSSGSPTYSVYPVLEAL